MGVATWSGSMLEWGAELSALKDRIGSVLPRKELRRSVSDFIDGLLSDAERKTGWLLAEQAGLARPYRMQSLLGRSRWDADAVLAEMRTYVIEALGHPDGVRVVDETGFVKKGVHSVGVGRQYSGTAGRIENCQVGVFLAYAGPHGQALIDRRLYLPKDWAEDMVRLAAGEGAKGLRLYDWGRFRLPWTYEEGFERWVLFRRSRRDPEKHAYYMVFAPTGTSLAELAGAAGLRWTIEECFQRAKDDLGLDHCEARSWHGWHRHMTLVMAAAAFLAKLAADLRRAAEAKQNERSPPPQIAA